jgi:hypothetical protein
MSRDMCMYFLARTFIQPDAKVPTANVHVPFIAQFHLEVPIINTTSCDALLRKAASAKPSFHAPGVAGGHYTQAEHHAIYCALLERYAKDNPTKPEVHSHHVHHDHVSSRFLPHPKTDGLPRAFERYYDELDTPYTDQALLELLVAWTIHYTPESERTSDLFVACLNMLIRGMCSLQCTDPEPPHEQLPPSKMYLSLSQCCVPLVTIDMLMMLYNCFTPHNTHADGKLLDLPKVRVTRQSNQTQSHTTLEDVYRFEDTGVFFFWLVMRWLGAHQHELPDDFFDGDGWMTRLATGCLPKPYNATSILDVRKLRLPDLVCCSADLDVFAGRVRYPRDTYKLVPAAVEHEINHILDGVLIGAALSDVVFYPDMACFLPLHLVLKRCEHVYHHKLSGNPANGDSKWIKDALDHLTDIPICFDTHVPDRTDYSFQACLKESTSFRLHALVTQKIGFSAGLDKESLSDKLHYFLLYHAKVGLCHTHLTIRALISNPDLPKDSPAVKSYLKHREQYKRFTALALTAAPSSSSSSSSSS